MIDGEYVGQAVGRAYSHMTSRDPYGHLVARRLVYAALEALCEPGHSAVDVTQTIWRLDVAALRLLAAQAVFELRYIGWNPDQAAQEAESADPAPPEVQRQLARELSRLREQRRDDREG